MTKMTTFDACAIAEGFDGAEHTQDEYREAWQFLIDTGACWTLQGWYGRTAQALIDQGVCKPAPVKTASLVIEGLNAKAHPSRMGRHGHARMVDRNCDICRQQGE